MKKRICSISTMVLAVLILVCLFLPLVKLDLTAITGSISSLFTDSVMWESGVKYSTIKAFRELMRYRDSLGGRFWLFTLVLVVQVTIPVVIFGISWVKKKEKFLVNVLLAVLDFLYMLMVHLFLIPSNIRKIIGQMMDDSIAGDILSIFHADSWTEEFAQQAGEAYRDSLSLGFYIPLILLILIAAAGIAGYVISKREDLYQGPAGTVRSPQLSGGAGTGPSMTGINGIYKGARIDIRKGESLVIGRDAAQCSLVIQAEQVSRKHCVVSFDEITGQYRVVDYSANGTFINNTRRLMRNQPQFVRRGDVISIGNDQNSFRLN